MERDTGHCSCLFCLSRGSVAELVSSNAWYTSQLLPLSSFMTVFRVTCATLDALELRRIFRERGERIKEQVDYLSAFTGSQGRYSNKVLYD